MSTFILFHSDFLYVMIDHVKILHSVCIKIWFWILCNSPPFVCDSHAASAFTACPCRSKRW